MRVALISRLNLAFTDYFRQADEMAHFAHSTEIVLKKVGRTWSTWYIPKGMNQERVSNAERLVM